MNHPGPIMNPRILTVDDSKMVRIMVGKVLQPYACVLLEASNGAEALEVVRRDKPDLILLDYTMPVMDGLDTMTALRADPALQAIPVIMLTAEGSKDVMVKMANLGVRDYLVKPFKNEVLLERVGRVVALSAQAVPAPQPT